jgi:hypothetical protein
MHHPLEEVFGIISSFCLAYCCVSLMYLQVKLWRVVTFDPELRIEHGYSHWKSLDEKNQSMKSNWRNEVVGKIEILTPHQPK